MNTLPITLTLYYPTMAQVEAYAGFISMVSIGFGIFMLSLPVWHWSPHTTINKRKPFLVYAVIAINPIGAILIATSALLLNRVASEIFGWLALFTPLFLVYAF